MDESGAGTKGLLSQSYAQGLERISQHNDKIGFFQLPQDIIDEREKTWGNFFQKYSQELTDEIEINLRSPSDEEEDEADDDEEDENDDDDDDEEEDYYAKSKTPMRKTASMVQYWVDTGNPPYKLIDENLRSDTGSSLSEGLSPKAPHQSSMRNVTTKRDGTSNCSSVDTAAYILSNTNVTKKAETMAIVEGSKSPENDPTTSSKPVSPLKPNKSADEDKNSDRNNISLVKSLGKSKDASNILNKLEETILENSLNHSRPNSISISESDDSEVKDMMSPSMKITDILPTLQNWDKLVDKSAVHRLRRDSEVVSGDSSGRATPKSFSKVRKFHKRKLYTGRDSPMEIIVSSQPSSEDQIVPTGNNNHPAFQGTPKMNKRTNFKKRASLLAKRNSKLFSPPGNSKDGSETKTDGKTKTFFKSLGLVPSPRFNTKTKRKIISGVAKKRTPRKRKAKKSLQKRDLNHETDDGKSSGASSTSSKPIKDLLSLCTKKTLSVPIERLSETVLMKFKNNPKRRILRRRRKKSTKSITPPKTDQAEKKEVENKSENSEIQESDQNSQKKTKIHPQLEKIELDSQESDQSTIIICKARSDLNKTTSSQTRSKTSSSASEKSELTVKITTSQVENAKKDENVDTGKNKAENPTIRRLRRRPMLKKKEEDEKKRKTKKVKAKKIIVKHVNTNNEILEAVDSFTTNSFSSKDKKAVSSVEKLSNSQSKKEEKKEEKKKIKKDTKKQKEIEEEKKEVKKVAKKQNEKPEEKDVENEKPEEKDVENENKTETRKTMTVCTLRFTTDSDSFSESSSRPRKPRPEIKRRYSNPVITFSSDDEDDFVTAMKKNAEKYEKKLRSKSNKSSKPVEDQSTFVDNLIDEPVTLLLNTIAESDDEEIIQFSQTKPKVKTRKAVAKTDNSKKSSTKLATKSAAVQKSPEKKSPQKPTRISQRLSIVRTLSFDENSSKQSEETEESPPKKLKMENGVVNKQNTKKQSSKPAETIESNESSNESMKNIFEKSTRSSRIKRKADFEEDCDEPKNSEVRSPPVTRSQSPTKFFNSPSVLTTTRPPKRPLSPTKPLTKSPTKPSAKSPTKPPTKPQLRPKTPVNTLKINTKSPELKQLQVSIEKIPEKDLEKSFGFQSKKLSSPKKPVSPPKNTISFRKRVRLSQKRSLLSDGESSEADFIIQPPDNDEKLINDDSTSDIDSTKCTKLFHNPFEDCGKQLGRLLNRNIEKNRKVNRIENKNIKPVRTFRARSDSDSDD